LAQGRRERDRAVLEREKGRPITNAKNTKPERTAANPIRIPSKNPPNCLPHLQEQEQQESILVGKKIGEKRSPERPADQAKRLHLCVTKTPPITDQIPPPVVHPKRRAAAIS